MSKWVLGEITQIIHLSLELKKYPRGWKIARVKPHFKGEGCDRQAAKSYRPVALLSAISRITEALLAKQLDDYQENNCLLHRGVHGFRRGRGTHTAMLETWEYVLAKTEKGNLVAIDLLDTSAAFDTLVHLYLLRKMELEVGMGEDSIKWLASYLGDWLQYVVVGARSSSVRKTTRGAPQGGGFSPNLFRGYTNAIPEAGLIINDHENINRPGRAVEEDRGFLSRLVDEKNKLETEDQLDRSLRQEGVWDIVSWRQERTGDGEQYCLKQKTVEDDEDVLTTIYADDTQSRTSARSLKELERRNSVGL